MRPTLSVVAALLFANAAGMPLLTANTAETAPGPSPRPASLADEVLALSGVRRGLCVHLGATDGALTADLADHEGLLVHAITSSDDAVRAIRERLRATRLRGAASAERTSLSRLPYASDLVNLVVAEDLPALLKDGLSLTEVGRVLCPGGVACLGAGAAAPEDLQERLKAAGLDGRLARGARTWLLFTKPRPAGMDEWTHLLHGPNANPVSRDTLVAPPTELRWIDGPAWGTHNWGLGGWVSAGGRVFYVFQEKRLGYPGAVKLVARDAFNGLVLWTAPVGQIRMFPDQAPLIATADRVFTVVERGGPLVALDAATGRLVRAYVEVGSPAEVVHLDGTLLSATGREVVAAEAASGKVLWRAAASGRLACGDGLVFTQTYLGRGEHALTALDLATGAQRWRVTAAYPSLAHHPFYYRGTLVLTDRKTIDGYAAADGHRLWSYPATQALRGGVHDVVYGVQGLVWSHVYVQGATPYDTGAKTAWIGLDPATGEVRRRLEDADPETVIAERHRCAPDRPTERFFLFGSCNLVDVETGSFTRAVGQRTTCRSGFYPGNGLLYFSPSACACSDYLRGFVAAGPAGEEVPEVPDADRLEPGPARAGAPRAQMPQDEWPTYRGDFRRSARSTAAVDPELKPLWRAEVGGRLTAPVVAGGLVLVASVDGHRVVALDSATGSPRWTFTAGGRVDTPPTVDGGLVLFGSADGWVYCLRASDGALVWRFLAAPADRRLVASGQVESVWPVHGSVVVVDGVTYGAAGRHTDLDGGLLVWAVRPETGAVLWKQRVQGLPVANAFAGDLLTSDGKALYIGQWQFDLKTGANQRGAGAGCVRGGLSGFLDGDWFDQHNHKGRTGMVSGRARGQLLAVSPDRTYGLSTFADEEGKPNLSRGTNRPGRGDYHLFAQRGDKPDWSVPVPLRVRGMLLADTTLFVAGQPDPDLPELKGLKDKQRLAKLFAETPDEVVNPRAGAVWAVATADGRKLSGLDLDAPPVFDGLAAAGGRLYVALEDGTVRCLAAR